MTPHEKAEELITTFRFILSLPNAPLGDDKDRVAKQCALAVVSEQLDSHGKRIDMFADKQLDYWKQVEQ